MNLATVNHLVGVFVNEKGVDRKMNMVDLLVNIFEWVNYNSEMHKIVEEQKDKLITIRHLTESVIRHVWDSDEESKERLLGMTSELFGDVHDLGVVISVLMKCAQEMKNLDGAEKKAIVRTLFEHLLEYSNLTEDEKTLSKYAFSGMVEAVIWAKNGGLKKLQQRCSKLKCCA